MLKLCLIFEDLQVLKVGQRTINKGMSDINSSMATACQKVDEVINVTNSNVSLLKLLSYKTIDIEARSRRNNLIIRGVPEERDENCFQTVRRFICDHLGLDANRMFLVRAHRLGARKRDTRPFEPQKRPLIVAFRDFTDTVEILDNTKRLKGTYFSVDRDYPREIYEARKRLWPILKEKRKEHPKADVYIQYPARLMVDKVLIRDEFPDWFRVLNGKREVSVSTTEPLQKPTQSNSIFPKVPSQPMNSGTHNTEHVATHVNESNNERTFHSSNPVSRDNIISQPGQVNATAYESVPSSRENAFSNKSSPCILVNSSAMSERGARPNSVKMSTSMSTSQSATTLVKPSIVTPITTTSSVSTLVSSVAENILHPTSVSGSVSTSISVTSTTSALTQASTPVVSSMSKTIVPQECQGATSTSTSATTSLLTTTTVPLASVVSGTSSSVDNFDSACAEVTSVSHSTSGLSPHANIFKPSQMLKNDSGVESMPLDRSASVPRSFREAQNRNSNTEEEKS